MILPIALVTAWKIEDENKHGTSAGTRGFRAPGRLCVQKAGRPGLIVLSLGWLAALTAWILASVPDPRIPLHDFERTPVPTLLGTLAGTAAALALILHRRRAVTPPITVLSTAAVYLVFSLFVTFAAQLWSMTM